MTAETGTPAFGVEVARAGQALGNAAPAVQQSLAELVILTSDRAAAKAAKQAVEEVIKANGKAKHFDAGAWTRWAVMLGLAVFGAWWGLSNLFAERPTEAKVEKLIGESWMHHAQHPESKIQIELANKAIQDQRVQLGRIEEGVLNIKEKIEELRKKTQ